MKILDLKLQWIEEEISFALDNYAEEYYRQAFAFSELRQKLISYLMNEIPGSCLLIVGDNESLPIKQNFSFNSQEAYLNLEILIHEGIQKIFEENQELIAHQKRQIEQMISEYDTWAINLEE
jgi:hypothetical protein